MIFRLLTRCAIALLALGGLCAAPLVYEGFTPSFPVFANGGFGFNGPWTGSALYGSFTPGEGSLCYSRLQSNPGSISASPMNGAQTVAFAQRNLAAPLGTDNTTVYLSFLIEPSGTLSTQDEYYGIDFGGLFIGKPGMGAMQQYVIETYGGAGQVPSGKSATPGRLALLVVKAHFLPGNDQFTLYVDPTPGQPEPATGVTKADLDVGLVTAVDIWSVTFSSSVTIDEIRIGTTYADVVPASTSILSTLTCIVEGL